MFPSSSGRINGHGLSRRPFSSPILTRIKPERNVSHVTILARILDLLLSPYLRLERPATGTEPERGRVSFFDERRRCKRSVQRL
jgi:hypothetical protein